MKQFMDNDFLLSTDMARELYHDYAAKMPILDYHCHISPQEIAEDKQFENIAQIWLGGDHYKWRQMRSNGIAEEYITGNAPDREKFQKWAEKGCFMEPGSKEGLSFYNDLPEEQKYYSEYTDGESTENIKDGKEAGQGQDGSKLYNCGIYLTGTDKYTNELGGYITGPVAGIVSSSENMDYAVTFLKYMARD